MSELVRLSKLMSERGLCSRREADELIRDGLVKVDGVVIDQLGSKVPTQACIEILPRARQRLAEKVTILLNKPKGYVSSQPEKGYRAAVELITADNQDAGDRRRFHPRHLRGLAPAGRLDIDSQGLLVLTQDGVVAKRLIGQDSNIEKEYIVRVSGKIQSDGLDRMRAGSLVLEGRKLKPAVAEWINQDQLRIVLREGMKRQVRKMCEQVGLTVTALKRVRVGHVRLGKLAEGRWRYLREDETF